MFELTDLEQQATAIDAQYRTAVDALARRDDLSAPGKVQEAQRLDAQRRAQVTRLQETARQRHAAALAAAEQAAQAAKVAQLDAKRSLLGDVILADVCRRRIERLDGDGIAAMYKNAANDWEAAIVREYGTLALEGRTDTPTATRADYGALSELAQAPAADHELRELQQAGQRIEALDLAGYRASMADRLGVDARYVADPF